jgi:hypothetical protein
MRTLKPKHGSWRLLADQARREREEREPLVRVGPPAEAPKPADSEPEEAQPE